MNTMQYVVVIVMLLSTGAAQQGRRVSGQVRDVTGAAIENAIVTMRANGSSVTITTVQSDKTGKFVFTGAAPKLYDLLFQSPGFQAVAQTKRIEASHDITIPTIVMAVADIGGALVYQEPDSKKKH
jgi:hypothetical protein